LRKKRNAILDDGSVIFFQYNEYNNTHGLEISMMNWNILQIYCATTMPAG